MIPFTKMQGAGNDYIYVDNRDDLIKAPQELAIKISDRHFGVGSDGLVLICKSNVADARMRMFNPDGSESEMCGNASRCVARFVWERFGLNKNELTLETGAGIKSILIHEKDGKFVAATVDMGEPILEPKQIPVLGDSNEVCINQTHFTCVSMGNPHAVTFVENTDKAPVHTEGPLFEVNSVFPKKANIEFVQVVDKDHVRMRVWERGTGETLACGTGSCATGVACVLNQKTNRKIEMELLGGTLIIEWKESDNHVLMTGPAEFVFEGSWEND